MKHRAPQKEFKWGSEDFTLVGEAGVDHERRQREEREREQAKREAEERQAQAQQALWS